MSDYTSINPEQKKLILGYKAEAMNELTNVDLANQAYKDIVTATSETTNISKKIIGKYFKACYKCKVKELTDEADVISFLEE